MKRIVLLAIVALGGLLAFGSTATAAEQKGEGKQGKGAATRQERIERIKTELKLTDEQVEKIKPILQEEAKKLREVMQDSALTREQKQEKTKAAREEIRGKLKDILTKEQLEQWDKMRTQAQKGKKKQQ